MHEVFTAPAAMLLHFQTRLQGLLVFAREIIYPVAIHALEFDQVILRHTVN